MSGLLVRRNTRADQRRSPSPAVFLPDEGGQKSGRLAWYRNGHAAIPGGRGCRVMTQHLRGHRRGLEVHPAECDSVIAGSSQEDAPA